MKTLEGTLILKMMLPLLKRSYYVQNDRHPTRRHTKNLSNLKRKLKMFETYRMPLCQFPCKPEWRGNGNEQGNQCQDVRVLSEMNLKLIVFKAWSSPEEMCKPKMPWWWTCHDPVGIQWKQCHVSREEWLQTTLWCGENVQIDAI